MGLSVARVPIPPTNCGPCGRFPSPFGPWQEAHLSRYTASPCAAVPLPSGNPAPVGSVVMSRCLISSALAGLPNPDGFVWANRLAKAMKHSVHNNNFLCIGQLAALLQPPPLDTVIVETRMCASSRNDLLVCRLHIARFVGAPGADDRFVAVPIPRQAESDCRILQNRLLQFCLPPIFPAVSRDFHSGDVRPA